MNHAPALSEPRPRRRRRSQAEVRQRIVDAARALFGEQGYAASTTRDIAQRADVSETLLFRYFGTKSALFDHVVFEPFHAIADRFLGDERATGEMGSESLQSFLAFLDGNRRMLTALAVKGLADSEDERAAYRLDQMRRFYAEAAARVAREHAGAGAAPRTAPDLSVRLAFGMVLASSLFAEWLFPDGEPDRARLIAGIEDMITRALAPPPGD